jgi:PBP1b-binding outer membrane lipoprotein LpoB
MKKIMILLFIAFLFLAGCASNIASLQRESAANIGNNLKPDDIKITDVKRGAFNVYWKATTPDGTIYDCSADDMVRRVNCVK